MLETVRDGLYRLATPVPEDFLGETVNTYLIRGDGFDCVVDAGPPTSEATERLATAIEETGIGANGRPVRVLLTHAHPDHTGQVSWLREHLDATVYIHPLERQQRRLCETYLQDLEPALDAWLHFHGVETNEHADFFQAGGDYPVPSADEALEPGTAIDGGRYDWEVVWTPGHAPGHVSLYAPDAGLFIGGDVIHPHGASFILQAPWSMGNQQALYRQTLGELAEWDVETVLPGHGQCFADLTGAIDTARDELDTRQRDILTALTSEPRTAWDLAKLTTGAETLERYPTFRQGMVLMELLPSLEALADRDDVRVSVTGGHRTFRRVS